MFIFVMMVLLVLVVVLVRSRQQSPVGSAGAQAVQRHLTLSGGGVGGDSRRTGHIARMVLPSHSLGDPSWKAGKQEQTAV